MKFLSALVASACICLSQLGVTNAFTNGTILPSYLCGPAGDGYPKSLGGVLPLFKLTTNPNFVAVNGVDPNRPLDAVNGGSLLHTQLLVAGFHNQGAIAATPNPLLMTIIAKPDPANPNFVPVAGQIVPGKTHVIQLQSNSVTTPGVPDPNLALDGAFIYAMDLNNTQRVGTFTAFGANMQAWAACGPNAVGAVHNQLLSDVGTYDGLEWWAPFNLLVGDLVKFQGAGVTDGAFGAWSKTFKVVAPPTAPPMKPALTQILLFGTIEAFAFFIDEMRGATVPIVSFTATTTLQALNPFTNPNVATNPILSTVTSTSKYSPIAISIKTLLQQANNALGGYVTITVIATNKLGLTSLPSNPAIFPVGTVTNVVPTTLAPTVTPTTLAPTVTPTTLAPTVTPTTLAPTVTPTTALATTAKATTTKPTTATATTATPTTAVPTTATPTTALPTTAAPTTAAPTTVAPTTTAVLNAAAVATHNTAASCWIIVAGNVYDMTNYAANNLHPGGMAQITNNCGTDSSALYAGIGAHQPGKLATSTVLLGPLVAGFSTNTLFVLSNYQSPTAPTNQPAVIPSGFTALCDNSNSYSNQAMAYNMAASVDPDNACAFMASYADQLIANNANAAAPTTDNGTNNNNAAIIGGCVAGAIVLVGIIAIVAFVQISKKRANRTNENSTMMAAHAV